MGEERALATRMSPNWVIISVVWVGPDLVPDPLETAEMASEPREFLTRCFYQQGWVYSEGSNMAHVGVAREFACSAQSTITF